MIFDHELLAAIFDKPRDNRDTAYVALPPFKHVTLTMNIRPATLADIPAIMEIRFSVKENILANPDLVTDADCAVFLMQRGKGWVCEIAGQIVGFAIVDFQESNVWALFVRPEFEKMGVGKSLHDTMLNAFFTQTQELLWLSTEPGTRAERFYRLQGWTESGMKGDEVKFEMRAVDWIK